MNSPIKHTMHTQRGLTLVELLVSLAVFSILVAIAAPNFQSMTTGNKLTTYINQLSSDLALARSEAITRNTNVHVVVGDTTLTGVGPAGGTNWLTGWQVVTLNTVTGDLTPPLKTADPIPASASISITPTPGTIVITYRGDGTVSTGTVNFLFCDTTLPTGAPGKSLDIGTAGRVSIDSSDPCP